jgi:hypothetical protein
MKFLSATKRVLGTRFFISRRIRVAQNMKSGKAKTKSKTSQRAASRGKGSRKPPDLIAIREQITNLVGNEAVGMVETTIAEVEKGHYLALKYLFEMIGLYPTTGAEDSPGEDSLARTLLRRLGFPEDAAPVELKQENVVTKDTAQDPPAIPNDVLE